jgi:transposase
MVAIGIDISKGKFDVAVLREGKYLTKVFANTPAGHTAFLAWLETKGIAIEGTHVCLEATSSYYEALAEVLHAAGWVVSVVNPLSIKAFAEARLLRQKTDRSDARAIAQFCLASRPRPWEPPRPEVRELQRLLARREAIVHMRVQEQNRWHAAMGVARESIERLLRVLDEEERRLEKLIEEHIDRHPRFREKRELLKTIPAVGSRLSAHFLAWLPLDRLTDARAAVAFIGLSPRLRESGQWRGKATLCKLGHARLRKLLYLPALSALRCNAPAKALARRLRAAGKPAKLIVGAVMRKLVHWMFGVLKSAQPFNPSLAVARG